MQLLSILRGYARDLVRIRPCPDPAYARAFAEQVISARRSLWTFFVPTLFTGISLIIVLAPVAPLLPMVLGFLLPVIASLIGYHTITQDKGAFDNPYVLAAMALRVASCATFAAVGWAIVLLTALHSPGISSIQIFLLVCCANVIICLAPLVFQNFPVASFGFVGVLSMTSTYLILHSDVTSPEFTAFALVTVHLIVLRGCVDLSRGFVNSVIQGERLVAAERARSEEAAALAARETELHTREVALQAQSAEQGRRLALTEQERDRARAGQRRDQMLVLAATFEKSVLAVADGVAQAAHSLSVSSEELEKTASQSVTRAGAIAEQAAGASRSVTSVATAVGQLTQSITQIAERMRDHASASAHAMTLTDSNRTSIAALKSSAQEVGGIVKLIENVTSQTNMLALNAGIEASRAGDAGRGFAIVAGEVKHLAGEAGQAAAAIGRYVGSMRQEVDGAIARIGLTIDGIRNVTDIAAHISGAVAEQRSAADDIDRSAHAAAMHADDVRGHVADLTRDSRAAAQLSNTVNDTAGNLAAQALALRGSASDFLAHLRAA